MVDFGVALPLMILLSGSLYIFELGDNTGADGREVFCFDELQVSHSLPHAFCNALMSLT